MLVGLDRHGMKNRQMRCPRYSIIRIYSMTGAVDKWDRLALLTAHFCIMLSMRYTVRVLGRRLAGMPVSYQFIIKHVHQRFATPVNQAGYKMVMGS